MDTTCPRFLRTVTIAALLLAPACASPPPDMQQLEDLQAREAIRGVLLDYGRFLDGRDWEAYSHLFAEEGAWIGGFGTVEGPAAIQKFMEENIGPDNPGNTYHLLSNFVIEVNGDTATAWSRWAFVTPGADGRPVIAQGGHYDDRLVRVGGLWKFQRREAVLDIPRDGP